MIFFLDFSNWKLEGNKRKKKKEPQFLFLFQLPDVQYVDFIDCLEQIYNKKNVKGHSETNKTRKQ